MLFQKSPKKALGEMIVQAETLLTDPKIQLAEETRTVLTAALDSARNHLEKGDEKAMGPALETLAAGLAKCKPSDPGDNTPPPAGNKYRVIGTDLWTGKGLFRIGQILELPPAEAEALLKSGNIEPA